VLAIEAMCACQALDMLSPLKAARAVEAARRALRRRVPHLARDRVLSGDIADTEALIESGALRRAAEKVCGELR